VRFRLLYTLKTRLIKLFDVYLGLTFREKPVRLLNSSILLLQTGDLQNSITWSKVQSIENLGLSEKKREKYTIKENDVLLSVRGDTPKCLWMQNIPAGFSVYAASPIYIIRPNLQKLINFKHSTEEGFSFRLVSDEMMIDKNRAETIMYFSEYITWYLKSQIALRDLKGSLSGSSSKNITLEKLSALPVSIPDFNYLLPALEVIRLMEVLEQKMKEQLHNRKTYFELLLQKGQINTDENNY
jgi:hypothetical protein